MPNDDVKLYEMQQAVNPVRNLEDRSCWGSGVSCITMGGLVAFFLLPADKRELGHVCPL